MSTEAILVRDGILEDDLFQRHEGKSHVSTEEDEGHDGGEVGDPIRYDSNINDGKERDLSKSNGGKKSKNVNYQNWFFGNSSIRIENERDKESENKKRGEFCGEIIRIISKEVAIYERPDNGGGDSNFNMLPSGFIDGSEETKDFILVAQVIKKVGEGAKGKDDDDASTEKKWHIHKDIITVALNFEYSV